MRGVADEDKGNKSRQFQFKVGEIMDNQNAKLGIELDKIMNKQNTKLAIKLALIDLIHNMNRDTTFKLNLIIICVQFTMLFISLILQIVIPERKLGASIMNSIWSTAMLFLVIINIKIISYITCKLYLNSLYSKHSTGCPCYITISNWILPAYILYMRAIFYISFVVRIF